MRWLGVILMVLFTGCAGPGYHAHGGYHSGFRHSHHHHGGGDFLAVLEGLAAVADIAADVAEIAATSQPATEPPEPLPGLVGGP